MKRSLIDLGQQLLDAAKRAGADACDAMVVDGVSHSIEVRGGELEQAERAEGIDIGLRVMLGARQACVSASDISAEAIELMAQRAVEMARYAPDDAYLRQASADQLARDWDVEARLDVPISGQLVCAGLTQVGIIWRVTRHFDSTLGHKLYGLRADIRSRNTGLTRAQHDPQPDINPLCALSLLEFAAAHFN